MKIKMLITFLLLMKMVLQNILITFRVLKELKHLLMKIENL